MQGARGCGFVFLQFRILIENAVVSEAFSHLDSEARRFWVKIGASSLRNEYGKFKIVGVKP